MDVRPLSRSEINAVARTAGAFADSIEAAGRFAYGDTHESVLVKQAATAKDVSAQAAALSRELAGVDHAGNEAALGKLTDFVNGTAFWASTAHDAATSIVPGLPDSTAANSHFAPAADVTRALDALRPPASHAASDAREAATWANRLVASA